MRSWIELALLAALVSCGEDAADEACPPDSELTWATFGDPSDPEGVLNHYSVERSIGDGATLPIHIETRLVDFHIDRAALDQAFAELAEAERLDEDERGYLARRASRVDALMKTPARIAAVCEDIVEHYRAKVALALGKGKQAHDRREDIKRRIADREMARALKRH